MSVFHCAPISQPFPGCSSKPAALPRRSLGAALLLTRGSGHSCCSTFRIFFRPLSISYSVYTSPCQYFIPLTLPSLSVLLFFTSSPAPTIPRCSSFTDTGQRPLRLQYLYCTSLTVLSILFPLHLSAFPVLLFLNSSAAPTVPRCSSFTDTGQRPLRLQCLLNIF